MSTPWPSGVFEKSYSAESATSARIWRAVRIWNSTSDYERAAEKSFGSHTLRVAIKRAPACEESSLIISQTDFGCFFRSNWGSGHSGPDIWFRSRSWRGLCWQRRFPRGYFGHAWPFFRPRRHMPAPHCSPRFTWQLPNEGSSTCSRFLLHFSFCTRSTELGQRMQRLACYWNGFFRRAFFVKRHPPTGCNDLTALCFLRVIALSGRRLKEGAWQ